VKPAKKFESIISAALPGRHVSARLISITAALIVIMLFTAVLFIPINQKFVIVEKKTGKILYYTYVTPGDTFVITYTHSVNKSPVDDVFEIQPDYSIMLKKTVFRTFGVGIPIPSDLGEGKVMNIYDDRMEIDNINMPVKQCLYFVGVIADHRFKMHNLELHLNKLTEPQQTVQFEVRRMPLYILMRRNL